MSSTTTVAIRPAHDDERGDVHRLAALDSAPALRGEVLLALDDGRPVAALALADGRVVADPFRPTRDIVAMLRTRAAALAPASPPAGARHRALRALRAA